MNIQYQIILTLTLVVIQQVKCTIIANPVCVTRRPSDRDLIFTDINCTATAEVCPSNKQTYLIADEACVPDQYLGSQCSLQLVKMSSTPTDTIITVTIENGSLLVPHTNVTPVPVQLVYYNKTGSPDNCSIASLEVYRGENTSIEISHNGFTIRDNYTIMVEERQLAYDRADYDGELYRMNVSCDDVMTNESCLFFKVQKTSPAIVNAAKFNCRVPGTGGNKTDCSISTTTVYSSAASSTDMTSVTMTTTSMDTTATTDSQVLKYVVFGTGGSIGALILVILLLCVVIGCLARRNRKNYVITTQNNRQTEQHTDQQTQQQVPTSETAAAAEPVNTVEQTTTDSDQRENQVSSERQRAPSNPEDHTYAAIEPPKPVEVKSPQVPQATNPMIVHVEVTMDTSKVVAEDVDVKTKEEDNDMTVDTFKPKPKQKRERPSSFQLNEATDPHQSTFIQMYEPVTNIQVTHSPNCKPAEEYDQLVHDTTKKSQHNTVPSSVQYSKLDKQDQPALQENPSKPKPDMLHDIKSGYSVLVASSRHSRGSQPSPPPLPPPLDPNDSIVRKTTTKTYSFIYNSSTDEEDDEAAGSNTLPPLYDQPTSLSLVMAKNPAFNDTPEDSAAVGEFFVADKKEEPLYDIPPSSPVLSSQDSYVDMQGHDIHRV